MKQSNGFSLVELAMAVLIIGLLLAGALIPLSSQIDTRNIAETQRNMEAIREAVIGFAQANGRLPCPADGTIKAGVAGAGVELSSGSPSTCGQFYGVVPWSTLGVPEADGWGRRFSYYVSPIFADGSVTTTNTTGQSPSCTSPIPVPTSSFALCSMGNLTVNTRNETSHAPNPIGSWLPAVIISHGKNGSGAYTPTGGTTVVAMPANAGADETTNQVRNNSATNFVSRVQTPSQFGGCNDATGTFCEFDDLVVMISSNVLIARMVAAGKLP